MEMSYKYSYKENRMLKKLENYSIFSSDFFILVSWIFRFFFVFNNFVFFIFSFGFLFCMVVVSNCKIVNFFILFFIYRDKNFVLGMSKMIFCKIFIFDL